MTKTEPVSLEVAASLEVGLNVTCPLWAETLPMATALSLDAADAAYQAARGQSQAAGNASAGVSAEVSIVLGDDALVRELNRDFRGQDKATNVLSFPASKPDDAPPPAGEVILLGDIIVAFETIAAEAEGQGKSLADHFCHLVVHGMLHLLGHDHEADDMAKTMEALEINILAGLDIANPYEGGPYEDGPGDN